MSQTGLQYYSVLLHHEKRGYPSTPWSGIGGKGVIGWPLKQMLFALGCMVLAVQVLSSWIARQAYQIGLMIGGIMPFYWVFGAHSDDEHIFWPLWMFAAFAFAGFLAWGVTILARWSLDHLQGLFGNKPCSGPPTARAGMLPSLKALIVLGR
jgi:hypothetical protein